MKRYEAKNHAGIMFGIGLQELGIILVIALVIFGPTKLPQIGSGLGKAIRDFRKGVSSDDSEDATREAQKKLLRNRTDSAPRTSKALRTIVVHRMTAVSLCWCFVSGRCLGQIYGLWKPSPISEAGSV